jgi:hypothetical protein
MFLFFRKFQKQNFFDDRNWQFHSKSANTFRAKGRRICEKFFQGRQTIGISSEAIPWKTSHLCAAPHHPFGSVKPQSSAGEGLAQHISGSATRNNSTVDIPQSQAIGHLNRSIRRRAVIILTEFQGPTTCR